MLGLEATPHASANSNRVTIRLDIPFRCPAPPDLHRQLQTHTPPFRSCLIDVARLIDFETGNLLTRFQRRY
jgi:hypothetical protein